MKKLRDLIDYDLDLNITGITDDSRLVKDGFLFVATKGYNVDHFDYIDDAIKNGCSFIVCDREFNKNFPHIVVDNIFETYIELCKKYYEVDPKDFSLIGVTGTDGKTTTTTIIKELLEECAYIGTNGVWVNDIEESTSNTTPCISELYEDLKIIKDNNVNTVSMEVSSEALLHDRVHGFIFDVVCFTNITGDHLNVHKSFDDYIACKMKLLDHVKDDGYIVFNGDDNTLKIINKKNSISFGFNEDNDYVISDVKYLKRKTIITLRNNDLEWTINSPFIGEYNVYNVVMAFIVGHLFKVDDCLLLNKIEQLRSIKGRCEFLDYGQDFDIVLDYAHTINGINSILDTFSNYETIITVTGSAGGREVEKRSVIGKSVIEKSDFAIFTMDDPRFEDPDEIIDQMVGDNKDYYRIVDREDAIRFALSIAYPGSVVLILGKGRDNYMAIKDKKIHYNDFDVITNYFKKE